MEVNKGAVEIFYPGFKINNCKFAKKIDILTER